MPQAEALTGRPRPPAAAPRRSPPPPVHYPESDDEPMGESFLHIEVSADVFAILRAHLANRPDACVGCDNFIYYEEGNPGAVVTPDVFVVFGVPKRTDRRVFKVWEEGEVPSFVLEVTSKTTRRHDERGKKALYERLGVGEYWQFDPTGDYLEPRLKGRVLGDGGRYRELSLEGRDGGLCGFSEVLGLDFRLEGERLRFFDPARGEYLLNPEEQHEAHQQERRAHQEERRARREERQAYEEQRRALEAAQARIRELERQHRPKG